jgi:hypothetical protein
MIINKNIWLVALVLITAFPGCVKKTDNLFTGTADERIQIVLDALESKLMEPPGWKLYVYPAGLEAQGIEVGGLTYYLQFPDSNRVSMVSDFTVDISGVPKESGFRLKAAQRPSLIFDTYSYIHIAADPDPSVSFSPTNTGGYGWGTDFDFSFTKIEPSDSITLKGNLHNSDAYLLKATQEEIDAAFGGQLTHIMEKTVEFSQSGPFLYFPAADGSNIGLTFNLFLYRINFSSLVSGNLEGQSVPFSHTTTGLHLKYQVTIGGYTFQDLFWDENLQVYYIETGSGHVNITNATEPVFPLYAIIGISVSTVNVPVTPLQGQSAEFANVYATIKTDLKNGPYNLDLGEMNFIFDDQTKTMDLQVFVQQNGITFVCNFEYTYSIDNTGKVFFARTGADGNALAAENEMRPFLDYIENDNFLLDYFTGVSPVLGQFTSLEHPGFSFTGNLQ